MCKYRYCPLLYYNFSPLQFKSLFITLINFKMKLATNKEDNNNNTHLKTIVLDMTIYRVVLLPFQTNETIEPNRHCSHDRVYLTERSLNLEQSGLPWIPLNIWLTWIVSFLKQGSAALLPCPVLIWWRNKVCACANEAVQHI